MHFQFPLLQFSRLFGTLKDQTLTLGIFGFGKKKNILCIIVRSGRKFRNLVSGNLTF